MTVKEHLQLYAALKGLPQPQGLAVETVLQTMQLSGNDFDSAKTSFSSMFAKSNPFIYNQ